MSFEWPLVLLEDLTDGTTITYGVVKPGDECENGVLFVRGGDVVAGRIQTSQLRTITQEVSEQYSRTLLRGGELLVSLVGNPGEVAIAPKSLAGANIARQVGLIRIDACKADANYIQFFFRSKVGRDVLLAHSKGSVQQVINLKDLKSVKIPLPPQDTQRSIAGFMQALDDRITLLRETNATLEAIAQALFKSWFVDFDPVRAKMEGRAPEGMDEATAALFPNSFEETELGAVPRGWRVGKLGDVLALRNERTKPSEETKALPYVPIESITAKAPFLQEYKSGDGANSSLALFRKGDILFGAMRPYFHKVCIAPFDGVTRTTVFTLKSINPQASGFALFLAFQESSIDYATKHSEGSTIPYAKWKNSLENMPIVLPPESLQVAFSEVVSPFVDRANGNIEEAQNLATLRDSLLPRLISGQLRLPEVGEALQSI